MYKKLTVIILTVLLFSACQKEQLPTKALHLPEINLHGITETFSTVTENSVKDNFDGYEDYTAEILNSFHVNMENAILIPSIMTDDPANLETYVYDTIDNLCRHSNHIVKGYIIDLTYQSDGHYKKIAYYSVAVSEVLDGEQIEPGTIITIQEDKQGYLPLKLYREQVFSEAFSPHYKGEEENRAYMVDTIDKPLAKTDEEYVFFLSDGTPSEDIIGTYYSVTSGYGGKFKRNEDGLYEKAIPEIMRGLLSQHSIPLTLDELKEQITKAQN